MRCRHRVVGGYTRQCRDAGARARHIPVVRRAEMLAELMRLKPCLTVAGTHGKTTTTSLARRARCCGLDPTVINGGIINAYGTNARLGSGDWMVVEADESDGTFVRLPSTMGIVTNIDPEHLEHYGSFENLRDAFVRYMQNIPFYGAGIVCLDHPEVQALVGQVQDRRIITYGLNEQADIQATNITTRGLRRNLTLFAATGRPTRKRLSQTCSCPWRGHIIFKTRSRQLPQGWRCAPNRTRSVRHCRVLPE